MQWKTSHAVAWLGACTGTVLAFAAWAHAQGADEAKVKAGLEVWRSSGCSECHGAFANGEKERDEAPSLSVALAESTSDQALKLMRAACHRIPDEEDCRR